MKKLIEIIKDEEWYFCENIMETSKSQPYCNRGFENKEQIKRWCGDTVYNLLKETDYVRTTCERKCFKS